MPRAVFPGVPIGPYCSNSSHIGPTRSINSCLFPPSLFMGFSCTLLYCSREPLNTTVWLSGLYWAVVRRKLERKWVAPALGRCLCHFTGCTGSYGSWDDQLGGNRVTACG
ncbi:UNVERIFIED_CONTAM: hypothetical protein K2H54_048644 [Gekko kuhli]